MTTTTTSATNNTDDSSSNAGYTTLLMERHGQSTTQRRPGLLYSSAYHTPGKSVVALSLLQATHAPVWAMAAYLVLSVLSQSSRYVDHKRFSITTLSPSAGPS